MIIATAGHVDHGKTSLVRALTGVDTDRLPEEKRRGMSIDVGFAHAGDDGPGRIGIVDVPGHERYVANLLAGMVGVDLALLVVAADDGPMPQTREHLAIFAALGVGGCVVALTRVDRVGAERQAAARAEVEALLAGGRFAGAPIFPVVATTGAGVAALRGALDALAHEAPRPLADGAFRLAVDRSFLVDGAGRVVTGAVLAGRIRVGDRVVLSPHGAELRVRGVQAHGRPADAAAAGDRCALNLAGAALKDAAPARGDWIVAPALHAPTDRLDVRLVAAAGAPLPAHVGGLQLHLGAAAVGVRVALLGREPLAAGSHGFAQLVLDRPVAALHGDRFVLRDPAAGACRAGGRVVDPFAAARGRATPGRIAQLEALAEAAPERALLARLAAGGDEGVDFDRFAVARNLDAAGADALQRRPEVRIVALGTGRRALSTAGWQALQVRTVDALGRWHAAQPESVGPGEAALATQLGPPAVGRALLRAALGSLGAAGTVVAEGFRWRLAGHRPVLAAADALLLERVAARLVGAGRRPPIVGELAAALGLAQAELVDFLDRASRFGALVRVAPNRWFLPATVAELAGHARELAVATAAGFDAAAYRDRTGIGRNLTVQVLEFLDREGVTRFDGTRRFLPA